MLQRFATYGLARMAFKQLLGAFLAMVTVFAANAAANADPYRIVGVGDSLMAGYGLGPGEGFTERLQAKLREKGIAAEVANAGVSGDTSSGGLSRLDWSVPDGTQLVILELGANDMLRGITPDVTERNLDTMLARLTERKIPVLLVGMRAAPNLGADYQTTFDAIYPKLAQKYGVPLYPFFLDGIAADPQYLQADGMHPNPKGVDRMVDGILPTLEKLVATKPLD
jgi:acyl-CoA thioesterase-1